MFERFTPHARKVVVLAQEQARHLKHSQIGTEHLLLALLQEEEGRAAQVLASLGITFEAAREQVVRSAGTREQDSPEQMPFTPRAKQTIERALREALTLKHDYIGTEHLLLGLVHQKRNVGCQILRDLGADPKQVRNAVTLKLRASGVGPHTAP